MAEDYGSPLFAALRRAAGDDWTAYTEAPFVAQLSDGSLPRAAFLRYLRQDYVFLIHFARAWALAVVKSDRVDEMRAAAATVHALIDEEVRLHVETCCAEGIDEAELGRTVEHPANVAYTRYVLDAGARGDLLDLLAALAPCVFGYGEIGARLARDNEGGLAGHPYRAWIETYAGADYQGVCREVGGLVERVAARRLGPEPQASPRWPELCATFAAACRLEAAFWAMGFDENAGHQAR